MMDGLVLEEVEVSAVGGVEAGVQQSFGGE